MSKLMAGMRLLRAAWVMAREGVFYVLPAEAMDSAPFLARKTAKALTRSSVKRRIEAQRYNSRADNASAAENNREAAGTMARALHKLGPFYVKLGQFLATRPDIVGYAAARDLSALQDRVQPFPQEQAIVQLEKTLHRPLGQIFSRFDPPIAAASMAQVHSAFIAGTVIRNDGDNTIAEDDAADAAAGDGNNAAESKRAVKIMRPHLRRDFARDFASFYAAARFAEKHMPAMRRLRPVSVVENLEQTTHLEMDMRLEAAALSEMAENIAKHGDTGFRVPKVDWERSGRECLTMEWIEGIRISDTQALLQGGHNLEQLAITLMQSFLRHALRDGFFHADMHPGNLFVEQDGCIAAVDLGIMGRLGKKEKIFLAEILYGFITRDYHRIARVHFDAGYVPPHHNIESFAQANRAIGEPIYGQSSETISMARLLGLLFEITELFDMQTRPELLLLQKNMVVVEGVARTLDPQFNMWKAAEPVVRTWVAQNSGPAGLVKDMAVSANAVLHFARNVPQIIKRAEETGKALHSQAKHGWRLDKASLAELARLQARQSRFWRWSMAAAVFCVAAGLWDFLLQLSSFD